jgi:50S ribosomal protein L16 3-hydroxylase
MSQSNFNKSLAKYGIRLDLKSQMLFSGNRFYLNGEVVTFTDKSAVILTKLADNRELSLDDMNHSQITDEPLLQQLHEWYLAGYLHFHL